MTVSYLLCSKRYHFVVEWSSHNSHYTAFESYANLETLDSRSEPEIPSEFQKALDVNDKAREFFNNLASSYKGQYIGWISSGKRGLNRHLSSLGQH